MYTNINDHNIKLEGFGFYFNYTFTLNIGNNVLVTRPLFINSRPESNNKLELH